MMAIAAVIGGGSLLALAPAATAQELLREQGTLQPSQDEYTFTGTAGQAIAITMYSEEFDTVLALQDSTGQEIAFNDDYGRSLNSTIVTTLPADGNYTVVARSFSGAGGQYTLTVRPATEYEQVYSQAWSYYMQGDFAQAIELFTEAIAVDPSQPLAYADRADARWGQYYTGLGEEFNFENPPELPADLVAAITEDYEQAAELFEQAGDTETAAALREQLMFLQQQQ
jgi:tetratricopeptide (TPR) repeat protein